MFRQERTSLVEATRKGEIARATRTEISQDLVRKKVSRVGRADYRKAIAAKLSETPGTMKRTPPQGNTATLGDGLGRTSPGGGYFA